MVSTIHFHQRKNTMRILILALAALLLTGCTVPAAPPPLPTPSPTPDALAAYRAAYAEFQTAYTALARRMDSPHYDDADWRAETVRLAREWRDTVEALQAAEQPAGAEWAQAWPLIQEAMGEFIYVAGAVENAAEQNNEWLTLPARERLANGVNLLTEAKRIVEGK